MTTLSDDEKTALRIVGESALVHVAAMYAVAEALDGFAPLARAANSLLSLSKRGLIGCGDGIVSPYYVTLDGLVLLGADTP